MSVAVQLGQLFARRCIPDTNAVVVAATDDLAAVG